MAVADRVPATSIRTQPTWLLSVLPLPPHTRPRHRARTINPLRSVTYALHPSTRILTTAVTLHPRIVHHTRRSSPRAPRHQARWRTRSMDRGADLMFGTCSILGIRTGNLPPISHVPRARIRLMVAPALTKARAARRIRTRAAPARIVTC